MGSLDYLRLPICFGESDRDRGFRGWRRYAKNGEKIPPLSASSAVQPPDPGEVAQPQPVSLPMPSLRKMISAGQKPVKADWIRLQPTKTANSSHHGLTKWASVTLTSTIVPARIRIAFSIFIKIPALSAPIEPRIRSRLHPKRTRGLGLRLDIRFC
jgi:hypothetical protein